MTVSQQTNARVNLLGNPSDIYYGIVISSTINELRVKGTLNDADFIECSINGIQDEGFNFLIDNSISFLKQEGYHVHPFIFDIETNIPKQGGLAGSSAIIINLIKCLNTKFELDLNKRTIAHYCTIIEHEKVGITAGPSDRFIITFGGVKYMDYTSREYENYEIEDLSIESFPFWVGIRTKSVSSGDIHKFPYRAYPHNKELQDIIAELKKCAVLGRQAILDEDIRLLGELISRNQRLTTTYGTHGDPSKEVILQRRIDKEILDYCNANELPAVKLAGSSGSLVILSDEKPDFLLNFDLSKSLSKEYNLINSEPIITEIFKLKPGKSLD